MIYKSYKIKCFLSIGDLHNCFFFFNLELVVSGNFVLKRVGNLKSQSAFAGTGSLFSGLDSMLYFKCDQASDLWQQLELASELEYDLRDTVD